MMTVYNDFYWFTHTVLVASLKFLFFRSQSTSELTTSGLHVLIFIAVVYLPQKKELQTNKSTGENVIFPLQR